MKKTILDRLDEHTSKKEVSRSRLIGETLERILSKKESEEEFIGSVSPRSERFLSDPDIEWIEEKMEFIKKNRNTPDLQEIYMRDLVKYTSKIADWYTSRELQDFIVRSLRKPYAERVQSGVLSMLSRAFAFSRWREDENCWNEWFDKTFQTMKKVILERKWTPELRTDLFHNILASEILLGYDEEPIPTKLIEFIRDSLKTLNHKEREKYSLANYLVMVAKRNEENARDLKGVFLSLYQDEDVDSETKQYLRLLLRTPEFEGI